jgi:predicted dehydrogenase
MTPLKIAIIGFGKIAEDQHVPSIAANPRFELVATVSRRGKGVEGVRSFTSHQEMLHEAEGLDAVAICTPPLGRYDIARQCIEAGLHALLEKPPGVSLAEVEHLACIAEAGGTSLFTTWHAQHNPAVTAAAELLAGKQVKRMEIVWHEDVRKWHPGQQWIWEPGGFGVFDPGINALSIATRIFPGELFVREAELSIPENKQTPIAAKLRFASSIGGEATLTGDFNWDHRGEEAWDIRIETGDGTDLLLSHGGIQAAGRRHEAAKGGEGGISVPLCRVRDLIDERRSTWTVRPLRLVADAY